MATTTKFINCLPGDWTLLVDGATYSSCQLQRDGAVAIAVAGSKPAADATDHIVLQFWPMLALTLGTGDKVYGKPTGNSIGGVRLLQTTTE